MSDGIRQIDGNRPSPEQVDAGVRDEHEPASDASVAPVDSYADATGAAPSPDRPILPPNPVVASNGAHPQDGDSNWNENAELKRLARQAAGNDPLKQNMREDEAFRIFRAALSILRTNVFKPDTRAEGKAIAEFDGFEEKMIQTALVRAHSAHRRESGYAEFLRSDFSKGGRSFALFSQFVVENAARLGLVGTKPVAAKADRPARTARSGPALQAADVLALRIPPSIAAVAEIEGIIARIPAAQPQGTDLPARLTKARSIRAHLLQLGGDETARASSLKNTSVRRAVAAEIEDLEGIRDKATAVLVSSTTDFGDPRVDQIFDAGLREEAADWIARHRKEIPIDPAIFTSVFTDAFRAYAAIWLSELPAGSGTDVMTYSKSARKKAELTFGHAFASPEEEMAVKGVVARLTYHLVKFGASRHSEPDKAASKEAGAPSPAASVRNPSRRILSIDDLNSVVGTDIFEKLDGFYDEIRKGPNGAVAGVLPANADAERYAGVFYSLFLNYIRIASYEYGDSFGAQLLSANGLEPRITKSIFLRIDDAATRFDETSLNLLRRFFELHINNVNVPAARELRPTFYERAYSRSGAQPMPNNGSFIEYQGTGMRGFATKIPGIDRTKQTAFAAATGIGWQKFLSWGEVRENPASLDDKKWGAMTENWETIAAYAAEAGTVSNHIPKTLYNLLRINCPSNISHGLWLAQVDGANGQGREALQALAKANCPPNVRRDVWDAYTSWLIISGRIEDATVEPVSRDSRNSIVLAYDFLGDVAGRHGRKLDFWDFMCAIYPTARGIRASGGKLRIAVPELMIDLYDRNRGYMTWAQRVAARDLDTLVEPSTHSGHRRKQVLPEYWNIRKYTEPLARDFEIDHEALYTFVAGYLRWFVLIEGGMPVTDGSGNDVTSPSPDVETRYSIELDEDSTVKLFPGIHAKRAADRKLDIDVKNGIYDARLRFVGSYLTAVSLLDENASVAYGGGNSTSIGSLVDEYERLAKEHEARSNILKDRGILPPEDRAGARKFYREEFEEFMSRAIDGSEIIANIPMGSMILSFQIAREATPFAGGGRLALPIGDIVAGANGILLSNSDARATIVDMLRIRATLIGATAAGVTLPADTASLRGLAAVLWTGDPDSFDRAFKALERMKALVAYPASGASGKVQAQRPPSTGGVHARSTFGPYLPARQSWEDQFEEMLRGKQQDDDAVKRAIGSLADYFREIKFIYRRFWPETLRRIVNAHAIDADEAAVIYDTALQFFPTVGLPAAEGDIPRARNAGDMDIQIAAAAFDDYKDLFPRVRGGTCAVPVNRELLQQIVALHIENSGEGSRPDIRQVAAKAIEVLQRHNAAAQVSGHGVVRSEPLPSDGLLGSMLRSHLENWQASDGAGVDLGTVRQAYFTLLPTIRRRTIPADSDIEAAVRNSSGGKASAAGETAFLKSFVGHQMRSIDILLAMAGDGETGIDAFVEEPMSRSQLGNGKIVLLATAYVVDRMTRNLPVDLAAFAADLVPPYIDPASETYEWLINQYLELLRLWLEKTEGKMSNAAADAHIHMGEIASSRGSPPTSIEDLRTRTANAAGVGDFAELVSIEERANALRALLGQGKVNNTSLEDASRISFEGDTTGIRSQMGDELSAMVKRAADIQGRSAEFYLGLASPANTSNLNEAETTHLIGTTNKAIDSSTKIRTELSGISGYPRRTSEIVQALSRDPLSGSIASMIPAGALPEMDSPPSGTADAIKWFIASAGHYLGLAEDRLIADLEAAEGHRDALLSRDMESSLAEVGARETEISGQAMKIEVHLKTADKIAGDLVEISNAEGSAIPQDVGTLLSVRKKIDEFASGVGGTLDALSKESSALSTLVGGRIDGGVKTSSDITRTAYSTIAKLDQRHGKAGLEDALLALECTIEGAGKLGRRIEDAREKVRRAISDAEKFIVDAEARIPVSEATEPAETPPLSDPDQYEATFRQGTIKRDEQRAAVRNLEFLCNARVISTPKGSYLVRQQDAARVDEWRKTDRREALDITPILGKGFRIEAHAFGIRTAETRELGAQHPFSRIVRCTRNLTNQRGYELLLLSNLSQDEGLYPQFSELLMHLASADSTSSTNDINGIMRAWALAHMDALDKKYFSSTESSAPIRDGAYTHEEHDKWQMVGRELLSNPHIAMASLVSDGDIENNNPIWVGPIDVREFDDFRANDFAKVRYLNSRSGIWDSVDLRPHIESNPRLKIVVSPMSAEVPAMISYIRSHWTVSASPDHMDLGWLITNPRVSVATGNPAQTRKHFNFDFFIKDMLEPRGITTHGDSPPLATPEVQRLAVEAYRIVRSPAPSLNLRRVPAAAIASWIEALPNHRGNMAALAWHLRQNPDDDDLKSYAAKLHLIARYSDDFEAEATAIALLMSHAEKLSWAADADVQSDINRTYMKVLPQIYRNMHAPLFVSPHKALSWTNPETELVRPHRLWTVMKEMEPLMGGRMPDPEHLDAVHGRVGRAPGWIRGLMQWLPELARPLAIIALVYDRLPDDFHRRLLAIARDCFTESHLVDEARKGRIISDISELYRSQANPDVAESDAIIRGLEEELSGGMTVARWLTTNDDTPWRSPWRSWRTMPHIKRLGLLAPEMLKARDEVKSFVADELRRRSPQFDTFRSMSNFIERFPEFASTIAILHLVMPHLDIGSEGDTLQDRIFSHFTRMCPEDAEGADEFTKAFVDILTGPEMIGAIRRTLAMPFDETSPRTSAMELTGEEEPHLPTEIMSPLEKVSYWLPTLPKADPQKVPFTNHNLVAIPAASGEPRKYALALDSFDKRHPAFANTLGALLSALFICDKRQRNAIYARFSGEPPITPEDFVETIRQTSALGQMKRALAGKDISVEDYLISPVILEMYNDIIPEAVIDAEVNDLEMLPPADSAPFRQRIGAWQRYEAERLQSRLHSIGGRPAHVTREAWDELVKTPERVVSSYPAAYRKIAAIVYEADPSTSLYLRFMDWMNEKRGDLSSTGGGNRHAICTEAFEFLVNNRAVILAARRKLMADTEIARLEALLPSSDIGREDLTYKYIEDQVDATGIVPPIDSQEFQAQLAMWKEAEFRNFRQTMPPGTPDADLRAYIDERVRSAPDAYKKLSALLNISEVFIKCGDQFLSRMTDQFQQRVKRQGRNLTPDEAHRTMTLSYYELAVTYRDLILEKARQKVRDGTGKAAAAGNIFAKKGRPGGGEGGSNGTASPAGNGTPGVPFSPPPPAGATALPFHGISTYMNAAPYPQAGIPPPGASMMTGMPIMPISPGPMLH